MKGNDLNTTFAFERDLRGWLGAADPRQAPVSMRLRIAADLHDEAVSARSPLFGLRAFGRRLAPLANLAAAAFAVAFLVGATAIATRLGSAGPGASAPIGADTPQPGQFEGYAFEGIPVPLAALACLVAAAMAWAVAGTARFRAVTSGLVSFEFSDRDGGGLVTPRLQTVPLRVWAIAIAVVATQVILMVSSNIAALGMPTEWVAQALIALAADAVQTLVVVALLIRYRRLWRTDPLLLGGFFAYVVTALATGIAWQGAMRVFGSPIPFEAVEFLTIGFNLAFVAFVVGVARRAGVRTPPSRALLATGVGVSAAIAIAPFTRYSPVAVEEVLSIVGPFVYIAGWLLLVWAGARMWRSTVVGGRIPVVLVTAAGVLELAALIGQRLRAFFPAEWLTLSFSGTVDTTFGTTTNWFYVATIAPTIAATGGWLLLFLAVVIGLPRAGRTVAPAEDPGERGEAQTR